LTRGSIFLRIDFAEMMDARVKPAHDERVDQIDREMLW